jgi:ketosteroid isomerase-like protein
MNEKINPSIEIARQFVDLINAHDVKGLFNMMTPMHRFIDSLGTVVEGRETMEHGWREYFRMVPDYAIEIEKMFVDDPEVVMLGTARGTYSPDGTLREADAWSTPAAWFARIEGTLVQEWRVYADNEPIRLRIRAWGKE